MTQAAVRVICAAMEEASIHHAGIDPIDIATQVVDVLGILPIGFACPSYGVPHYHMYVNRHCRNCIEVYRLKGVEELDG